MKGLDLFLEKIRATPRPTLVTRYLALIADLPTEDEKTRRALDLADVLVEKKPAEAMRIAHMVFTADRSNLRALDIVIASMKARGRTGKVEVLKNERAKLAAELAASPHARQKDSAKLPAALFMPRLDEDEAAPLKPMPALEGGGTEHSRIAEIDLGAEGDASIPSDPLDRLFAPVRLPDAAHEPRTMISLVLPLPDDAGAASPAPAGKDPSLHLEHLQIAPIDTVLPEGQAAHPKAGQEAFAATLLLTEDRPRLEMSPAAAPSAPVVITPQAPLVAPGPSFWDDMRAELGRVAQSSSLLLVPFTRVERLHKLLPEGAQLPDEIVRSFAEIDHRPATQGRALALKWEMIQALWGGAPDGALAALLVELELTAATPAFFGLFLDALINARDFRRAKAVALATLIVPRGAARLAYARVAWARLPRLYAALKLKPFAWSEDEGVPALIERLSKRATPRLSGLLPGTARRSG